MKEGSIGQTARVEEEKITGKETGEKVMKKEREERMGGIEPGREARLGCLSFITLAGCLLVLHLV